ncbi:MAG: SCO1664 family protein [Hyphomicrobiales bacterium]
MGEVELNFGEAERLLRESEFLDCRQIWSSNYVYLARMCSPDGQPFAAIYKPRDGERPLWDFPDGTLYRREVAAYRLANLLGWQFVPPTIVRTEGPEGLGSLQLYIGHDPQSHFFTQRETPELVPQLQRMAVFDYVANNADRKGGHCLLDEQRRIWGIDHGLCFHADYKMRTVIWDWSEEPIAEEWLEAVEAARGHVEAGDEEAAPLLELLDGSERKALVRRMETLLADRVYPRPGPHRHYPWPLV